VTLLSPQGHTGPVENQPKVSRTFITFLCYVKLHWKDEGHKYLFNYVSYYFQSTDWKLSSN